MSRVLKDALLQSCSAMSGAESLLSGHTTDFALRVLAKIKKKSVSHSTRGVWEAESTARIHRVDVLTVLSPPELSHERENSKQ